MSVRRKKTRHKALLHFIPFTVKKQIFDCAKSDQKKNFIKKDQEHRPVSNNWRSPSSIRIARITLLTELTAAAARSSDGLAHQRI